MRQCGERWTDQYGCREPYEEHRCTVDYGHPHRGHFCFCGAVRIEHIGTLTRFVVDRSDAA